MQRNISVSVNDRNQELSQNWGHTATTDYYKANKQEKEYNFLKSSSHMFPTDKPQYFVHFSF